MITQAAEDSERRCKARQRFHHCVLRVRVGCHKVTREYDQVGLRRIGHLHIFADLLARHEGPDVDVGKLRDPEPVEGLRQAGQGNRLRGHLQIQPPVEQAVRARKERCCGHDVGRPFQKHAARRRFDRLAVASPNPARQPHNRLRNGEHQRDQRAEERTHRPRHERRHQQRVGPREMDRRRAAEDAKIVDPQRHVDCHDQA